MTKYELKTEFRQGMLSILALGGRSFQNTTMERILKPKQRELSSLEVVQEENRPYNRNFDN